MTEDAVKFSESHDEPAVSSVMVRATIVLAAFIAYLPAWNAPFHFDDFSLFTDPVVVGDDFLQSLLAPERTRILTYLSFRVDYELFGLDPRAFHLVNILLFCAAVWVAGLLFENLLELRAAWLATVIFALHPLATESGAYVFGRASLLSVGFAAACWLAWSRRLPYLSVGFFALAVLSKEDAAAMVILLIAYERWVVQSPRGRWSALAAPLATMFAFGALVVARVLVATVVTPGSGAGFSLGEITAGRYLLTQGKVVWLYLKLLVVPWGQSFDHPVALSSPDDVLAWVGWVLLALCVYGCQRATGIDSRWFWPLAGLILLAPTSTAFPLADLASERRMMLPMLAFAPVLALGVAEILRTSSLGTATVVIALLLGGLTFHRAQVWTSAETLWRDTIRTAPYKTRPKLQLARALESKGEPALEERFDLLVAARKLSPNDPLVLGELGVFLLQIQRPGPALDAFQQARDAAPDDPQLAANAGSALLLLGRAPEAVAAFDRALELDPCNFDARNNLILVRRTQGRSEQVAELAVQPARCRWTPQQADSIKEAAAALIQ